MGYSERVCQLCGISFNIGRMRTPGTCKCMCTSRFFFFSKCFPKTQNKIDIYQTR